jgi:receptor-type tyrosine-protein phosphatase A
MLNFNYYDSAGIGRTGTYIALDALNQLGRKKGNVNVAEYVKKMRENRMNMVQTYVSLHEDN